MKKTPEIEIKEALMEGGMVEPVSSSSKGSRVEFLCRLIPGQEKEWLRLVEYLLKMDANEDSALFIARQYLIKDDKLVFGWFIELEAKTVATLKLLSQALCSILRKTKPGPGPSKPTLKKSIKPSPMKVVQSFTDNEGAKIEITEMPLPHVKKDLNSPSKPVWSEEHGRFVGGGKGAQFTGRS